MCCNRRVSMDRRIPPFRVLFFLFLLIPNSALFVCAPAGAQTVDAAKFQAYITSSKYQGKVQQAIASISPEVFQKCPTLQSSGSKVTLLKSVEFGQDGIPSSGSWVNRFPVSGCGNDTTLNIFFTATADGPEVKSFIGLPGSTIASPVLQRDAMLSAVGAFATVEHDCKSVPIVKNTHFGGFGTKSVPIAPPKAGEKLSAWWELWAMSGCGHVLDVPINFVTDATGTKFLVSSKDIVVH